MGPRFRSPCIQACRVPRPCILPWAHLPPGVYTVQPLLPGVPTVTPRLLLLACVLVLAAGCGQKGPLYMPDESQDESTEETDD